MTFAAGPVAAQSTYTWTGGGSDNNWGTAGNWSGSSVPPAEVSENGGNYVVVFSGTNRPSTVNNLGNWSRSFGQMYFDSGAASFTLSGDTFGFRAYLGSGLQQIFQNSASTQTIGVSAFSFRPNADSRINLNAGDLVISSPDFYIDSASSVRQLVVTGSDSTRRTVTFAGNVNKGGSGQDPDLFIQGNKRVLVTGSLAFGSGNDGSVYIDDGVLQFSGAGTMTGGRPVIGTTSGSGNAAVWLDTAGRTFAQELELRNGSSGRRTVGGLNTSGTVTFSGAVVGNAGDYDLSAVTGGAVVFSGVRNFTSTVHVNRPNGATTYGGTVILSGTTNSTGGVGVYGGTLQFSDFNQLGSGYFAFEQDTGDSGTLRYTGGSTTVTKTLWSNKAGQTRAAIDVSQAGTTLTWTQSGGEFSRNLTKVGAGTLAFNGPITGAGGNVAVEAGMLILTGSNSYSGGTVVSGGTLEVSGGGSQGGSPAALGTGTVSIASGAQVKYWLSLGSSNTVSNAFLLSGGTLHTTDGFNTYSGRITLASGSSTISGQYEDAITLSGGLTGSGHVLFTQTGGTGGWAAPTYVLTGTGANTGTVRVSGASGGGPTKLQVANVNALQSATLDLATGDTGLVEFTVAGTNTYALGGLQGSRNLAFGGNALSVGGNGQSTSYSGSLSGSGAFTKTGAGNLTITGSNVYTGATAVAQGRLSVNGSLGTTAVTVLNTGTLGGSGSIGGSVGVLGGGVLAPGNSIASLAAGATTFTGTSGGGGGATFEYEYDSTAPLTSAADLLVVSGSLSVGSGSLITFADIAGTAQSFADGTSFALINYSGTWDGGYFTYGSTVLADGSKFTVGSQQWEIDYNRTNPTGLANFTGDYLPSSSFVAITAVPEPSTWLLGLAGLACGGRMLRRRRG